MKAARIHGLRDVRVDEIEEPSLRPGTIKVKVAYSGICGSDLGYFSHGAPTPPAGALLDEAGPRVLGHEFAGHVVAASEDVDTVQVGDLVAVRPNVACGDCLPCRQNHPQVCTRRAAVGLHGGGGGFSEYVVVDASQAFVMPSGVTPTEAALIEPLSVAWHAVSRVTLRPDATALVVGAGAIGLGVMMALKAQGVEKIAAVEPNRLRQEAARSLGVEVLGDDASSLLDKLVGEYANGFDLVFDASGAGQPVFDAILASLQPGGTAMIVAVYHTAVTWSPTAVIRNEITITGSYGYWDEDYRAVTEAISTRAIDPGLLVTKIVPLHDIVSGAFLHLTEGPGKAEDIKVLVSPAPVPS